MATEGFLLPILSAFQTILRATVNTELNTIDSTLETVNSNWILIEDFQKWPEYHLVVRIWPLPNENQVNSEQDGGNLITPNYGIITTVTVQHDVDETRLTYLDKYLTAVAHSVVKGSTGTAWTLNGKADIIRMTSIAYSDVYTNVEQNTLAQTGGIIWTVEKEYNIV